MSNPLSKQTVKTDVYSLFEGATGETLENLNRIRTTTKAKFKKVGDDEDIFRTHYVFELLLQGNLEYNQYTANDGDPNKEMNGFIQAALSSMENKAKTKRGPSLMGPEDDTKMAIQIGYDNDNGNETPEEEKGHFLRGITLMIDHVAPSLRLLLKQRWLAVTGKNIEDNVAATFTKIHPKWKNDLGKGNDQSKTIEGESIDKWDISLLCAVLLQHLDGELPNQPPPPPPTFLDIKKIKEARNTLLMHASKCEMTVAAYETLAKLAEPVCDSLDSVEIPSDRVLSEPQLKWLRRELSSALSGGDLTTEVRDKLAEVQSSLKHHITTEHELTRDVVRETVQVATEAVASSFEKSNQYQHGVVLSNIQGDIQAVDDKLRRLGALLQSQKEQLVSSANSSSYVIHEIESAIDHDHWILVGETIALLEKALLPYAEVGASRMYEIVSPQLDGNGCPVTHSGAGLIYGTHEWQYQCNLSQRTTSRCTCDMWANALRNVRTFEEHELSWSNSRLSSWCSDETGWQMAKLFMNRLEENETEVGLYAILSFLADCNVFVDTRMASTGNRSDRDLCEVTAKIVAHSVEELSTILEDGSRFSLWIARDYAEYRHLLFAMRQVWNNIWHTGKMSVRNIEYGWSLYLSESLLRSTDMLMDLSGKGMAGGPRACSYDCTRPAKTALRKLEELSLTPLGQVAVVERAKRMQGQVPDYEIPQIPSVSIPFELAGSFKQLEWDGVRSRCGNAFVKSNGLKKNRNIVILCYIFLPLLVAIAVDNILAFCLYAFPILWLVKYMDEYIGRVQKEEAAIIAKELTEEYTDIGVTFAVNYDGKICVRGVQRPKLKLASLLRDSVDIWLNDIDKSKPPTELGGLISPEEWRQVIGLVDRLGYIPKFSTYAWLMLFGLMVLVMFGIFQIWNRWQPSISYRPKFVNEVAPVYFNHTKVFNGTNAIFCYEKILTIYVGIWDYIWPFLPFFAVLLLLPFNFMGWRIGISHFARKVESVAKEIDFRFKYINLKVSAVAEPRRGWWQQRNMGDRLGFRVSSRPNTSMVQL